MKKVIFVCVHNSGRSQMAEAMVNKWGEGYVVAESAGTVPGGQLNLQAVAVMEEIGFDMSSHYPKPITQEMVQTADRIITMGCGVNADNCPVLFLPSEDWGLDDPKDQPIEKVREIRDEIEIRVKQLIKELKEG